MTHTLHQGDCRAVPANAKAMIEERLRDRHADDRIVFECKTGPTKTGVLRMDAWAMKSSWSKPHTYGYEIKISRSDFMRDDKWQGYLPYCSEFYFCCPRGLIQPEELPADVGLLWLNSTGSQLYTKRKAARRDVQIHENLWRYIVMCRSTIRDREHTLTDSRDYWRNWLKLRAENRVLGREVAAGIREVVEYTQRENRRLLVENAALADVRERMIELGFDPTKSVNKWQVNRKLDELSGALPHGFQAKLQGARDVLDNLIQMLDANQW